MKILIIDDDTDDIELFCDAIKEVDKKIECVSAGNGEDGLRLLRKSSSKPDYIFLDLNMPGMNGKQCLVNLKKDPHLRAIPVIIYTTSKLKEDNEETRQLGATYFLTKPSKLKDLKDAIAGILNGIGDAG